MHPGNSSVSAAETPVPGAEPPRRRAFQRESFDGEYVRLLAAGDRATEDHFFRYFSELLRIKLRSRLRDASLIEDVRQETLLRVFAAIKQDSGLRNPESLGGFVNSVCNNLLFEVYRRNARNRTVELGDYDALDERSSVESELVTEERRREVRRVLDELPPKDRELLRLVFYEGAGRDAICREYQVEREYLRVLVHRAKARFRTLLIQSGGAEASNHGA